MNYTEWERTRKFLDKKWLERSNLFVINEMDLEEELNKSIITIKMKDIFSSEGYPITEKSYLRRDGDSWSIIKIYNLFSIMDSEIEKELNSFNTTKRKDSGDIVPVKLRTAFTSNSFSLPEDAKISGKDGEWVIDVGAGYTIIYEEGKLNIYTGDEKTHDIRREDGKLRIVYIGPQGSPIFKIREKYYTFEFWVS
jgi:hypothetical protein